MAETNGQRAENIVAAATKLFGERGYHGVSVRDICSYLGGNCSIISYYFGGKAGLYREVLKRQFLVWEQVLEEAAAKGLDPRQEIEAICEGALKLRRKSPSFAGILLRESAFPSPIYQDALRDHTSKYGNRLIDLIRNGQRGGIFKSTIRAEQAAQSLVLLLKAPPAESTVSERDYFDTVKSIFMEGVSAPAKKSESGRPIGKQSATARGDYRR